MFATRPHLHSASDLHERHRLELIIATARAFLAGIALVAVSLDPTGPSRHAELVYRLLISYDVFSALLLILFRFGPLNSVRLSPLFHAVDLLWAVAITFLTEGPNSSYFAFFVFVLLAAAYRWSFRETLLTGLAAVALFVIEGLAVHTGAIPALLNVSTLIMRSAYFLLATFLLAFLADQAKGLKAEAIVSNRLIDRVSVREGLATSMRLVIGDLLRLVGSAKAAIALEETSTGRLVLWEAFLDPGETEAKFRTTDLDPDRRDEFIFPLPDDVSAFEMSRLKRLGPRRTLAIERGGRRVRTSPVQLPSGVAGEKWRTLMGLSIGVSGDWSGRLFLLDPTARPSGEKRLRFLQNVISHVSPVLHNVYLLRRLRLRAGAIERARVGRELHDSVIQALIGLEMQIDVTRRAAGSTGGLAERLGHIQDLLREEILNIRDLMEQLRPRPADTKHLLERLAELADRFQRETGIETRFRSSVAHAELPPELCHELTRVVQEALTNVRRHSDASEVGINLAVDDWAWKLTVVDNGKGFGWEGSASHAQLAAGRLGPRTIRERVEAIGGKLQVRSGPKGARLEIVGRLKKPWIVSPTA